MGDSKGDKDNSVAKSDEGDENHGTEPETGSDDGQESLVAVDSRRVGYVIMNPDFYKEPKKNVRITGPCSAHEYVTRKPRG